jgi:hypothetical protein
VPDLAGLDLRLNPSAAPLAYPGRLVQELVPDAALLAGGWLYRQDPDGRLLLDGGPLRRARTVADALAELGRPGPAQRRPILAVGSNASPGQLLFKYAQEPGEPVVPLRAAHVTGLAVAFSAHVSRAGYLPWAPLAGPALRMHGLVLWLDERQRSVLDGTEPNYRPVPLPPAVGGVPPGCEVYRSRWGLLRLGRGPRPAGPQPAVWAALLARPWFARLAGTADPAAAALRLAAEPALRERARQELARHGLAAPDGLGVLPAQRPPM